MAESVFTCEEVLAPVHNEIKCAVCSLPFLAIKFGKKYCSPSCKQRRPRPNRKPRASGKHRTEQRSCKACSGIFSAKADNDRLFCCDECRADWTRIQKAVRFSVRKPAQPKAKVRSCRDCSSPIPKAAQRCGPCRITARKKSKAETRSKDKASGLVAARRKARKMKLRVVSVETVNLVAVLERDNWTCQLCGIKTPKALRGTYDDRAPEVDHIVSIAEGGEHSYRNTQCACRKCNIAKSAKPMGQMRLFG